ncbi:MAG: hypothetical protein IBX45_13205, partial [Campylobacterales bacterium]|nr:hypothetical protein [Campylobacterales bacterium]
MSPKDLEQAYQKNKSRFHDYIDTIKKKAPWDIYTIINPTLIKNPYISEFPKKFFKNNKVGHGSYIEFSKILMKYYGRNIGLLVFYLITFLLYRFSFANQKKKNPRVILDVFGLVEKTVQSGSFNENYLVGVYKVFERCNIPHAILLRPYQQKRNPFVLVNFFKIIHQDARDFIIEYELLRILDFMALLRLILFYPFKTFRLVQKEKVHEDKIFNFCLKEDLESFSFESLTRYILGKNLAKMDDIEKIYSWNEFQAVERGFNYGIRKSNSRVELVGLQFYLNYETYFNTVVDDLDYEMLSSPHRVLVNGKYYLQDREKVKYDVGVSLRYGDLFRFEGVEEELNVLLLGSYAEKDTKNMLNAVRKFDNVIFKSHPAVDVSVFGKLPKNITVSSDSIYTLFKNAKVVISTASGTCTEAVACGVSVVVVASRDGLTANPLVEYGKGEIWDMAYGEDEIADA